MRSGAAFTLIELIIAITISVLISAVLYLSLRSALESWQTSQDHLFLQQISSRIMEELTEGLPETYGLRDALEVTDGSPYQLSTVMPWTDDTHDVATGIYTYTLNKHIKPGTGLPIAEALLPQAKEYRVVPLVFIDTAKTDDYPRVRLNMNVPAGSILRFSFHPDYKKDPDVLTTFRYDDLNKAIFIDNKEGSRNISQNLFGVKITDFHLRYFDNTNTEVGKDGSISAADILAITGLEIAFKAESKNRNTYETVSFVSLRNAPMHSGNLVLREESHFPIPNSQDVKAFFLTNLSGIDNGDTLILNAKPETGKPWRLTVQFSRASGEGASFIELYTIEYPPGNKVYSDRLRLPIELGLNLLTLGPNGLYDYDDDGMQDTVLLEGKVTLEVEKMDIQGAAVFVRP